MVPTPFLPIEPAASISGQFSRKRLPPFCAYRSDWKKRATRPPLSSVLSCTIGNGRLLRIDHIIDPVGVLIIISQRQIVHQYILPLSHWQLTYIEFEKKQLGFSTEAGESLRSNSLNFWPFWTRKVKFIFAPWSPVSVLTLYLYLRRVIYNSICKLFNRTW